MYSFFNQTKKKLVLFLNFYDATRLDAPNHVYKKIQHLIRNSYAYVTHFRYAKANEQTS